MVAGAEPHPLDALVNDPTGSPEMCGEEEFTDVIDDMVAVEAPRLFAIV